MYEIGIYDEGSGLFKVSLSGSTSETQEKICRVVVASRSMHIWCYTIMDGYVHHFLIMIHILG